MAANEARGRPPSFSARRKHYARRLKRQILRFRLAGLRTALLRRATREDVIQCYRGILSREPEDVHALDGHLVGRPLLGEVIAKLSHSGELRARHLRSNLALDRAREPNYLARSLQDVQRVQAYFGHYGYLVEALGAPALQALISGHAPLYVRQSAGTGYRVVATSTHDRHEEGELQLQLYRDDALLYVMGTTIVPGDVLGLAERHAILISRIQGVPGAYWEIRQATKDFGEVHPSAALWAAVQGFARANAISAIVGVAAHNQIASSERQAHLFQKAYDGFFASVGAEPWSDDFFLFDPRRERPASTALSRAHLKRAERKRRLKAEIAQAAAVAAGRWRRPAAAGPVGRGDPLPSSGLDAPAAFQRSLAQV